MARAVGFPQIYGRGISNNLYRYKYLTIPWKTGPLNKYYRAARLIQAAWRYRRPISKVAIKGARAIARRYNMRKRKSVFKQARTSNKRKRISGTKFQKPRDQSDYTGGLNTYNFNLSRKTLWSSPIQFGKKFTTFSNTLGQITGGRVFVKGIKVCFKAINESVNAFDAASLHFAIIQFKSTGDQAGIPNNFFSQPGGGDAGSERDFTFVDAATAPAWDWRYDCNGINPTRYNIVTHKKWRLDPRDVSKSSKNYLLTHEHFYYVNRTFQFENKDDTQVRNPLYMVIWYDSILPLTPETQTVRNFVDFHLNTVCYFKSVN